MENFSVECYLCHETISVPNCQDHECFEGRKIYFSEGYIYPYDPKKQLKKAKNADLKLTWTRDKVMQLLNAIHARSQNFNTAMNLKRPLWEDISAEVGMPITTTTVKWKNMKKHYHRQVEKRAYGVNWIYFNKMHEIMHAKSPHGVPEIPKGTPPPNKRLKETSGGFFWDDYGIKALLNGLRRHKADFRDPNIKRKDIFSQIGEELNVTLVEVYTKWKNLKRRARTLEKNSNWKFQEEILNLIEELQDENLEYEFEEKVQEPPKKITKLEQNVKKVTAEEEEGEEEAEEEAEEEEEEDEEDEEDEDDEEDLFRFLKAEKEETRRWREETRKHRQLVVKLLKQLISVCQKKT